MNSYRMAALAAVTLAFGMVAFASEPAAKIKRVPDAGPKEELHVIGLYEGATKTGNEIHGGRARVKVDRPGKTITLALVAYESVTWEVMPTPDTQVTKVILGGYHRHAIKGLPEAVQVVKANYEENERGTRLPYAHEVESPNYRQLARQLHEMTGMKIASFQGKYRYTHDSPFVVDRRIGEDRLQADYPKPTPLEQLPKLKFQGVHLTGGDLFRWLGSFGDFTLGGADKNSLKPLPRDVLQIAYDPAGKKHYGRGMHEVYEVDLANGQAKKMNMGINVPRLSWPCGIAFDSKRGRLVVASRQYLYSYEPATGNWSAFSEFKHLGFVALGYRPKDDSLYGLVQPHQENAGPQLIQFNAAGAMVQKIKLPPPMLPGMLGRGHIEVQAQIIAVENYLVLILNPGMHGSEEAKDPFARIFLVEPETGKTWLTWQEKRP